MNIAFETKLAVVEENARSHGRAEVAIARERITAAKVAFDQAMASIEERFNLECWNGFAAECGKGEIEQMVSYQKHFKDYKEVK